METELMKWVGAIGFPAAAFLLMYRMVSTTIEQHTVAIGAMTTALTELRDAMRMVRRCPLAERSEAKDAPS